MRRIVVTPAGRERYLSVLSAYVQQAQREGSIDEWHLWLNTNVPSDVAYIRGLAGLGDWVRVVELPEPVREVSNANISRFFPHAADPDCVYVRLDDDIVYLEPGFFDTLIGFRVAHPAPFLVYGNIVNNAVISHLHQRNGRFRYPLLGGYNCTDPIGWGDPRFAETVHRAFLADVRAGRLDLWHRSFSAWHCMNHERVSINCISWLGREFARFGGRVGADEEQWLSVDKPSSLGSHSHNVICGAAVASHFAFFTQREHLDATDLLSQYRALAQQAAPDGTGPRFSALGTL